MYTKKKKKTMINNNNDLLEKDTRCLLFILYTTYNQERHLFMGGGV